jgi:hypothetical protein
MKFSNKAYDRLKWLAQIGLPALGTLYFALAGIWGLPAADHVDGTIVAVDAFLGVILAISSNGYVTPAQGYISVDQSTPGGTLLMGFNETDQAKLLADVASREAVTFKVTNVKPEPLPLRSVPPPKDANGNSA